MIKRPRISLEDLGIEQETPADRSSRIAHCQDSARSKLDRIAEYNAREDDRTKKNFRKIVQGGLWLDMNDLMGDMPGASRFRTQNDATMLPPSATVAKPLLQNARTQMRPGHQRLTEEFPTSHDDMLMEDFDFEHQSSPQRTLPVQPRTAASPKAKPIRQSLQEDVVSRWGSKGVPVGPPWTTRKFLGETRGGDSVPVWKVCNQRTGSSIDKLFRIEAIANRVVGLLNQSGDSNDPRAVSLIAAYDKRDRLLKEARQLEKNSEGKIMKTERLRTIRAEIAQLDHRLGI